MMTPVLVTPVLMIHSIQPPPTPNPPPPTPTPHTGVSPSDITTAVTRLSQRTAEGIGAPKIPNVRWEDVGGLEDVKQAILDTVELPLKHPQLFSHGLRRKYGWEKGGGGGCVGWWLCGGWAQGVHERACMYVCV